MRTTTLALLALICLAGCNKSPAGATNTAESSVDTSQYPAPEITYGHEAGEAGPAEPQGLPVDTSPLVSHQPEAELPAPNATPRDVVATFLEATRGGNEMLASALLTRRALEETSKKGLTVQPPGSPSMSYKIGRVEAAPNNRGVYVSSVWSETFDDGETESFEVVWVLRQEEIGWRIAGMAAQLEPGELPLFLNFEEPTELARKMNEAKSNLATAASEDQSAPPPPGIRQAQQPETTLPR